METYAGIDLHSSNNFVGVINEKDKFLYGKRHANRLDDVLRALDPFKDRLKGVVVESTFNWYWLVDGLQDHGYRVDLANPPAIKQYEGLKHTDDKWDSFWLAHMYRLGILPEGYIYPKEHRAVRDLLRRKLLFVRQRTAQILSLQSMISRNFGFKMSNNEIKKIRQSLEDIENGEYGIGEDCGEDISIERLKSRPVISLCIGCKNKRESLEKLTEPWCSLVDEFPANTVKLAKAFHYGYWV